jgi:hypothetical protein
MWRDIINFLVPVCEYVPVTIILASNLWVAKLQENSVLLLWEVNPCMALFSSLFPTYRAQTWVVPIKRAEWPFYFSCLLAKYWLSMLETWCNVQRARSGVGQIAVRLVIEPTYQMLCLSSRHIIILKTRHESYSQNPFSDDFWANGRRTVNFYCRRKGWQGGLCS